ncbi:MAG: hypothetical protein DPW09_26140 [Anaerolineae bacterium]|nr:hypothetical protein [Anaerolineae bacterium]MCL4303531.1 hypothetical protein [Anaerolineae bacterium]MCQ3976924.1 hypothetical protein [Anaerolineae bacterium]
MAKKKFLKRLFNFDPLGDADILAALDEMPDGEKSRTVREALRQYLGMVRAQPTLDDVMGLINELHSEVRLLRVQGVLKENVREPLDDDKYSSKLLKLGF